MWKPLLWGIASAVLSTTAMARDVAGPRMDVPGGAVEGTIDPADGASIFRGIPFAAPPLGRLRWKAPQPVVPWNGLRAADKRAPACLQNDYGWNRADYLSAREDCLTLDVRTPNMHARLPVMVWIHGGSNRAGSAGDTVLSHITEDGVVLVAIQYRLGIFGFLAPRGAAAEANGMAGNYGLMDQIAALRWIKANIASFGGDPNNITIFGESAGSQDVSLLLASPQARGLFQKAIMESGTPDFGMPPRPLSDGFAIADQAEALLDAKGELAKLRTASVAALLEADRKIEDPDIVNPNDFVWLRPTIDGAVLPAAPRMLFQSAPRRPVIIGTNRVEFGPSPGSVDLDQYLKAWFGEHAQAAKAWYGDPARKRSKRLGHLELEIATDVVFRCPSGNLAELLSRRDWPVWRYQFDVTGNSKLTAHAAEIPWVMGGKTFRSDGAVVSLARYWTNFAKTGDPNGSGPAWPKFRPDSRLYAAFDNQGVHARTDLGAPLCALIGTL